MYLSGIKAEIIGVIREKPTVVKAGENNVANVTVTFTEGYGEKSHLKNAECSFWQSDADSISKYPAGHTIIVSGILTTEAYLNENNEPSVKIKINVRDWRSCQKLSKSDNNMTQGSAASQRTNYKSNNDTSQTPPMKQFSEEDQYLIKALDAIITFGPYKAMKVKEVLRKDINYVYKTAQELKNAEWKKVFTVAYNYYVRCQENKNKNIIKGVRR